MTVTQGKRRRGMRTRAVNTDQSAYEEHKAYVLSVLAMRCQWLTPPDREAAYHDAYEVMLRKERRPGSRPFATHELRSFLAKTALHKALDQGKAAERRYTVGLDQAVERPDQAAPVEDRVADQQERVPVREMVAELSDRQAAIVKLRFWADLTAEETWTYLGVSRRTYRREFERAMRQLGDRYALVRTGRWCESKRSLVLAYVGGVASKNKALEARMHLSGCPGCRRMAAELQEAARGAAAVLPLPDIAFNQGPLTRTVEAGAALREQLTDAAGQVKQHAIGVVSRADPASAHYAAGARPGAMAAAVASCVAIGGGAATYCATEGVPDTLKPVLGMERVDSTADRPKAKSREETSEPSPTTTSQTVSGPRQAVPEPSTSGPPPAPQPRPVPANELPAQEFGPEQAPSTASSAGSPARGGSSESDGPASGGGGGGGEEFGP